MTLQKKWRSTTAIPLMILAAVATVLANDETRPRGMEDLRRLEQSILREINLLRTRPREYAERVLVPLKATAERLPPDDASDFQAIKVFLNNEHQVDFIRIAEGDTANEALAVIDEAIAALKATQPLPALQSNDVLTSSATYFSRDFLVGGKQRPPHVDSLGRAPRARIASFGTSRKALDEWTRFTKKLDNKRQVTVRVFEKGGNFFWIELPPRGGYRYWYVPKSFGQFVAQHGRERALPEINRAGHECVVKVDVRARSIHYGDAAIRYPLSVPTHGECVVWGPWSRKWAARGLVCWWIIDPGIPSRGHRKTLLDRDFHYAGVGCAWSEEIGWVATFDAAAEPLLSFDALQDK